MLVVAVATFLTDITEWGWDPAPPRKVIFRDDIPKLPQLLPRYLPIDADRRLTVALTEHPDNELAALALRLQRACGLRIGEVLDLELDCVHEIDGNGAWLKVPLGKLATERMVPLDAETLEVIDRIQPEVVVGFGGYVSVPAYLAARRRRLPLVVHEGNALPGIANKLGARLTTHVATSYPDTQLPGELGNFAVAAHRQTHGQVFWNIDKK